MRLRNPKILGLLRKGCSITFPSGVMFSRPANTEFIETGMRGEDMNEYQPIDQYSLNEEGLEAALKYEEFYAESLKEDVEPYDEKEDWQ